MKDFSDEAAPSICIISPNTEPAPWGPQSLPTKEVMKIRRCPSTVQFVLCPVLQRDGP